MKSFYTLLILTFGCFRVFAQEMVFFEDFSGNTLNPEVWNVITGDGCPTMCGWGNNELQVYTNSNHQLRDGELIITAKNESPGYTSTRLNTRGKFEIQYGTVEIRAQIPPGKGLWPAFWMLGSNIDKVGWPACGEIDIMEYVGREPEQIFTSLHTTSNHGDNASTKTTIIKGIEEGFHDYRMTWTPEAITFFVDGEHVYTYSPEIKTKENWPFDQPFYLLVNLAVGGKFGGPEVEDAAFPAIYRIAHIKVWKTE